MSDFDELEPIPLRPKDPTELYPWTFDWSRVLNANDTIAQIATSVAVYDGGVDGNPNAILYSNAVASGLVVLQPFVGGISGVNYKITQDITTGTGLKYRVTALLPVRAK
jgi:hypothetical protein